MSGFSRTWWGQHFIEALEDFTDIGRLSRGRSYAGDSRIKAWDLSEGKVTAKIRGNINPYFGVYKEPTYQISVQMTPISKTDWKKIIQSIGSKAGLVTKLMTNEMPETIEKAFAALDTRLLPRDYEDFKVSCSCPDYAVPCKHIAGTCYRLASLLDADPFLLFEMRGLERQTLHKELAKSPLGKILSASLTAEDQEHTPATSYFTQPKPATLPKTVDPNAFWRGEKPLPTTIEPSKPTVVPAVLIKQGGDYPPFWNRQSSFIEVMEALYERIRNGRQKWM